MPDLSNLTVALIGNTNPAIYWSTENEFSDAYGRAGVSVVPFMEGPQGFDDLILALERGDEVDFVHWTRTKSFADQAGDVRQWRMIAACARRNVPLVAVHLDAFRGLNREGQLDKDPYFKGVDYLFTADGGYPEDWARRGLNHRWLPPAISERWLGIGEHRAEYECDVVFLGGWDGYGHREWRHRSELIDHLSRRFGGRFLALPRKGQSRIVGRDVNDVYASAKIAVGDSCLPPYSDGTPRSHYVSDRVPECLGRGALFVHPTVEGVTAEGGVFAGAPGLWTWEVGDWGALDEAIDAALLCANDPGHTAIRQGNIDFIADSETYTDRVRQLVGVLTQEGAL